ncbi:MAG: uracil-DNA glycosylase [Verrucomicrobiales bacterium]|nr:uracil-DNA glycosylase [Verrucomicrobiales bacterium]
MGSDHPVAAGLKVLAGILETQKQRGHETVNISPEAEALLGGMPLKFMEAGRRPAVVSKSTAAAALPASLPAAQPVGASAGTPATSPPASLPPVATTPKSEKEVRACLNQIFKDLRSSEECRALGSLFEKVVFATGNPTADVVVVGDAPGFEEENAKKPLVGPARDKLEQMLKAMGLPIEEVYFSNVVKFRPRKGDGRLQGSSDRNCTGDEMRVCLPFLKREIEAVSPKVILALGKTAAEGLLEKGGTVNGFRQELPVFAGVPVVVTEDPRNLLRDERELSPDKVKEKKRLVWEDMLKVMEFAGLVISEKQRGYFK